jgi:hypothetical protein
MSKWCNDYVLDLPLEEIKDVANRMCVCSQQPTTYEEAITTYMLADVDISSADFTGPSDGDVSGRKLTVNAQSNIEVDASGGTTHIALVDTTNLILLYVTSCPTKNLMAGNYCNTPAWDIEFSDPK